jgi:phosphohistidine phosphatase
MKRLYVVRNAHAAIGALDRERELDEQGLKELESIGTQIVAQGMRPNIILTSSARRSIETAKHIREVFGLLVNVIDIREDLYGADISKILEILPSLPDEKNSVMLIASNPSVTELLTSITNSDYEDIPNGTVVVVELRLRHWKDLGLKMGRELAFLRPKIGENNSGKITTNL